MRKLTLKYKLESNIEMSLDDTAKLNLYLREEYEKRIIFRVIFELYNINSAIQRVQRDNSKTYI